MPKICWEGISSISWVEYAHSVIKLIRQQPTPARQKLPVNDVEHRLLLPSPPQRLNGRLPPHDARHHRWEVHGQRLLDQDKVAGGQGKAGKGEKTKLKFDGFCDICISPWFGSIPQEI